MTREQAIEKVRKCLALAGSSNAHEAAAAMRHAQALMRKYGIDDAAVELSQVKQAQTTTAASSIPIWVNSLAQLVAKAFACRCWFKVRSSTHVIFLGIGAKPKVATYAFTVLRRQLQADRAKFYRKTRGKRVNRIGRADQFALAWIQSVAGELTQFSDQVPGIVDQALDRIRTGLGLEKHESRRHGKEQLDRKALAAGHAAGSKARLRHGVDGYSPKQLGGA